MIYIIIAIIVIGLISSIFSSIKENWKKILKWIVIIGLGLLAVSFVLANLGFFIPLTIVVVVAYFIIQAIASKKQEAAEIADIQQYINEPYPVFTPELVAEKLSKSINNIKDTDNNSNDRKFVGSALPLGRANAFLNYHNTSIYNEEPLYFSPIYSHDDEEFREYGLCITDSGLYIAYETYDDKESQYNKEIVTIPYNSIYKVYITDEKAKKQKVTVKYTNRSVIEIEEGASKVSLPNLYRFLLSVLTLKLPLAYMNNAVVNEDELESTIARAEQKFQAMMQQNKNQNVLENAAAAGNFANIQTQFSEIRNYMNTRQCHGYAAEYGNNNIDRLLGKRVTNAAMQLDSNGRQVKNGADRIVNGQEIQTKYCASASKSIGEAFENGQAKYIDSNGEMMQIEVPRNQYNEALELMQKRIDNGEVPGAAPGTPAAKYVRKGYFTYQQAYNIACSGTVESLVVDTVAGFVSSVGGASITAVLTFASAIWNGIDGKEAAKQSVISFGRVVGKGIFITVVSMQLSRTQGAFAFVGKPLNDLSKSIANSSFSNTSVGKALGLNNVTSKILVADTIQFAIVFGPDLCRAMVGRISLKQLLKNSAVAAASLAGGAKGAAIGQALIPIPFVGAAVGSLVGGAVTGFLAKAVLDGFVEDDAKQMFRILKEEFIDVVMMSNLNQQELDEVCKLTIQNEKLDKYLRDMYQYGNYREYARDLYISPAVVQVIKKRSTITKKIYQEEVASIIDEEFIEAVKT